MTLRHGSKQHCNRFPERQRLALVLCHYEGMTMQEAGAIIGASEEGIESLLSRGRRTLRKNLESEWRQLVPATGEIMTGSDKRLATGAADSGARATLLEQLEQVLDRAGSDQQRWPTVQLERLAQFVSSDAEAGRRVTEARALRARAGRRASQRRAGDR